jgi:hypothetical protein
MHHHSGSVYPSHVGARSFVHILRRSLERLLVGGGARHLWNQHQSLFLHSTPVRPSRTIWNGGALGGVVLHRSLDGPLVLLVDRMVRGSRVL